MQCKNPALTFPTETPKLQLLTKQLLMGKIYQIIFTVQKFYFLLG